IVAHVEDDLSVRQQEPDVDARATRELRDVVESLEHAEEDAGLEAPVEPADAVGLDRDRKGSLAGLRIERRDESLIGQQRRVDATGEVAEGLERIGGLGADLRDEVARLRGISV